MADVVQEQAVRVDIDRFADYCAAVFEAVGCNAENARILADNLVSADVRGTHTHGTQYVSIYARAMKDGALNPNPVPSIITETQSMVLWDGDGGLGHLNGFRVMNELVERTKKHGQGIGMAVVRNSSHLGAVGYLALQAAKQDVIGFSMSNTPPVTVPTNGRGRIIGNGPFAWGAPATSEMPEIVFDVAWSISAGSRMQLFARRGEQLPDGWVVDAEGLPSNDPTIFAKGGALMPAGLHKGYGMIVLVEILTAVLGGGQLVDKITGFTGGWTNAFIVIDPTVFGSLEDFKSRLVELEQMIHAIEPAADADRVYVPGEPEHWHTKDSQENGLELGAEIWSELSSIGEETGLTEKLEAARK
jgi:LDH2 family malate/lactate/ureidoglycolate dehydrogenase